MALHEIYIEVVWQWNGYGEIPGLAMRRRGRVNTFLSFVAATQDGFSVARERVIIDVIPRDHSTLGSHTCEEGMIALSLYLSLACTFDSQIDVEVFRFFFVRY